MGLFRFSMLTWRKIFFVLDFESLPDAPSCNMSKRRIIYILFCALFFVSHHSRANDFFFSHLTAEDGLSNNIVQCIKKDSRGYLWIGCNNALNRYDGSKIIKFLHNQNDTTSITRGGINNLLEDQDGCLWIATKSGVCTFDYKTEKFTKIYDVEDEDIAARSFLLTKKNELILVTSSGLRLFNRQTRKFENIFRNELNNGASVIVEDEYGNLVIGTWGQGLAILNMETKDYYIKRFPSDTDLNAANTVETMIFDKSGTLWIGTRNGFYSARAVSKPSGTDYEISLATDNHNKKLPISDNKIHSLASDDFGRLWIGTENGLNIYNPETKVLRIIHSLRDDKNGLNNNNISCMYNEPGIGIWLGTYQGGINFYSRGNIPIADKFPFITKSDNRMIQYVKAVYEDANGKIWIGTDYGLFRFSRNFQLEKTYKNTSEPNSLSIGGITAIFTDRLGGFWVGTWGGGVNKLDTRTETFKNFSRQDGINTTDTTITGDCNIIAFAEDRNNNLWIATKFRILDRYNRKYNSFSHFDIAQQIGRPNMEINSMCKDDDDNLWIGAIGAGLIKFDTRTLRAELFEPPQTKDIDSENKLSIVNVYSVYYASRNQIWLGTGTGLCLFNPETRTFTNYATNRGLNSETVLGVTADSKDHLWVSTLKGISKFDPKTGFFSNFDAADGMISNAEVAYRGNAGLLFFAGVNGIIAFNPDSIWKNEKVPSIVFTDFKLFDKSVLFSRNLMPYHVNETSQVTLNYMQNSISIEFAALNFIQPEKNLYSCMLEGFDTDWNYLGPKRETKYTNLNPGTYFFKVRAANNSGIWNNSEKVLKIIIRPPWWKTLVFRISLVIMIVIVTLVIIRIRTVQLIHQREELIQKVKERTSEIEKQQIELKKQADELLRANAILMANQKEIELQKEAITTQKNKLEEKNGILEMQKEQIIQQKIQTEKMAAQLHEADQKKIRFLTNISHEFRTPLSLIFSPLEKSLREYGQIEKDKLHIRLKLMYRNTLRLLRLINEFLDISKIEAGLLKLCVGKGNISNYLSGIVETYRYLAEQRNVRFDFRSEMEHDVCFFDSDKIEKIVNNLLSNAFKFTPRGGTISVELMPVRPNGTDEPEFFKIVVTDTGIGIDEKFQKQIFERFFQIDSKEGQISGTGIGLALTQELITIYRGKIELESKPGAGSRFTIELPCSINQFSSTEISSELITSFSQNMEWKINEETLGFETNEQTGEKFDSNLPIVLLVEDNEDIIRFLQEQFSEDYNFVFATDGFKGYEKAISFMPQAIILDVMMPRMNGYQLCEKLKSDERTCNIPVIFLTALAEKSDQMEGLEYGADDYITKPFDIDLLKIKVNNLIETRKKLKQLYQKKIDFNSFGLAPDSADEKLMQKVLLIIDREMTNSDFGVEELSRMVGLSRTHLYRKIQEIANQSPVEFIRNLRLGKAATLLKQNKYYISEVAYMTGFSEMSYFRKIFKDFYGVSPSDYAKGAVNQSDKS